MKHYLLHFAAVYSIALVLLITVLVFGLNLGGLTLIPTLVACALISVGHFVKKNTVFQTIMKKFNWFGAQVLSQLSSVVSLCCF
jgi:Flp pilus assembly pilin Flp